MSVEYQVLRSAEYGWVVVRLSRTQGYRGAFIDAVELANALAEREAEQSGRETKVVIADDDACHLGVPAGDAGRHGR
ncbi:hypothetical protein ACXU4B_14245 [Dyella soli]|uniref:Uncharacterized protein n=1 Tax=Dyella soli TaxID=522319 RepID=A0A4R0YER3_9GAMM|nr:hypothetical protein [Dyella soli]TCI06716.1 hypothetical protein EZM97_29190 [Dyella soli]